MGAHFYSITLQLAGRLNHLKKRLICSRVEVNVNQGLTLRFFRLTSVFCGCDTARSAIELAILFFGARCDNTFFSNQFRRQENEFNAEVHINSFSLGI